MRVRISIYGDCITILNKSNIHRYDLPPQITIHRLNKIKILPPTIDWFMHHIKSLVSTSSLYKDLLNGNAIAVSDGSFYPLEKIGSHGWIVSTSDGAQWVQGRLSKAATGVN